MPISGARPGPRRQAKLFGHRGGVIARARNRSAGCEGLPVRSGNNPSDSRLEKNLHLELNEAAGQLVGNAQQRSAKAWSGCDVVAVRAAIPPK